MRALRLAGAICALALLAVAGKGTALAQTGGAQTFTLPAGGRATITFEAFCTNFGQDFPEGIQAPNDVAPDNIRAALAYIQTNNLAASQANALEAQYAIWQLAGASGSPTGGAQAQAVVSAATTPPAAPQGATSVVDAVKNGQATVTVDSWEPIGDAVPIGSATDNFYGRGTLTVVNTSNQQLVLYMPVGTLFPPSTAGAQTMAGYATQVQQQQATAAATTAATSAATAAATSPATAAATTAATSAATTATTSAATAAPTSTPGTLPTTAEPGGPNSGLLVLMLLGAIMIIGSGWMLSQRSR